MQQLRRRIMEMYESAWRSPGIRLSASVIVRTVDAHRVRARLPNGEVDMERVDWGTVALDMAEALSALADGVTKLHVEHMNLCPTKADLMEGRR